MCGFCSENTAIELAKIFALGSSGKIIYPDNIYAKWFREIVRNERNNKWVFYLAAIALGKNCPPELEKC